MNASRKSNTVENYTQNNELLDKFIQYINFIYNLINILVLVYSIKVYIQPLYNICFEIFYKT